MLSKGQDFAIQLNHQCIQCPQCLPTHIDRYMHLFIVHNHQFNVSTVFSNISYAQAIWFTAWNIYIYSYIFYITLFSRRLAFFQRIKTALLLRRRAATAIASWHGCMRSTIQLLCAERNISRRARLPAGPRR